MNRRKQIAPGEKIGLRLTSAERTLLLEDLTMLPKEYEHAIRATAFKEPVMLTLDDLDDLSGYVAAEANHCADVKKRKKLDVVFEKIRHLLDTHDDQPSQAKPSVDIQKAKLLAASGVQLAEWAARALIAAEQLGIKNNQLEHLWLSPAHRDVLICVPAISKAIKSKLAKQKSTFTVAEGASMTMALAEELSGEGASKHVAVLLVARHLIDRLQEAIADSFEPETKTGKKPKTAKKTKALYQFKITLVESEPLIWRRIQVLDGTLDKLHEHIQTAMGWTNSHLHRFEIAGQQYGDPLLFEEDFAEFGLIDSTRTLISQILPREGKRFSFLYEYDFGDGWEHEILFEGNPKRKPGQAYPVCLEGERACPPEDVGGISGYDEFLAAISNTRHQRHREFLEWSGPFDSAKFDAQDATKAMKAGLPNWRDDIDLV